MTQIPSGNYTNLISGYFGLNQTGGNFSQADANVLWGEFLTQNGIPSEADVTSPPWSGFLAANNINPQTASQAQLDTAYTQFLNQPSIQVAFSQFLQTTYTNLISTLNLSPDEVANRKLIITVIDMLIALIATMQDSISVVGKNILIQGQLQNMYTEEMDKIPVYVGGSNNSAVVNSTNFSNWTLGYAHITMQDYLSAAIAGGPATSNGVVTTPGVGPQLILGNVSTIAQIQNNYDSLTSTSNSTVITYLKSLLPNGNSLSSNDNNVVTALGEALAQVNNMSPKPSYTGHISWAGKNNSSIENPVYEPSDFANIPESWFNYLMVFETGQSFTGDNASFFTNTLLPAVKAAATNDYNAEINSQGVTPTGLSFQQFQSNNTLKITFTTGNSSNTVYTTFSPNETYPQKLSQADAAFSALLNKTIGSSTVLSMITTADLHTDWNAVLNTKFTTNPSDAGTAGDIQKRAQQNQLLQQYLQADEVRQQVVANVQSTEQTVLNQFQSGLTQVGQIISTSIQELENILGAIFRPQ